MKWKNPPKIKIYEALGSIVDGRVKTAGDTAKVYSSTGNKFYEVTFDKSKKAIMANDNGSYWQGYLGYPSIAYLMMGNLLPFDKDVAGLLAGIAWKDINQKFKNNYDKVIEEILSRKNEAEKEKVENFVDMVAEEISELNLSILGSKTKPPDGY